MIAKPKVNTRLTLGGLFQILEGADAAKDESTCRDVLIDRRKFLKVEGESRALALSSAGCTIAEVFIKAMVF